MKAMPSLIVALLVLSAGTASAWGQYMQAPGSGRSATQLQRDAALFGSPAPVHTATRTVMLRPGVKLINVASGETVAFPSGEQAVAWTFSESIAGTNTDLGLLLPGLPNATGVRVYIDRSNLFTGG